MTGRTPLTMKEFLKYKEERKEVARFMRRLYNQQLTTSSGGNISSLTSDGHIIITPSATDKATMKWKKTAVLTMNGENLTPYLKPSIEAELHQRIYRKNSDVKYIIHAHPVYSSSFTATGFRIDTSLTGEAKIICGEPSYVPYALMGSPELAEIVSEAAVNNDILLLENHGVITTGTSITETFNKIEVLENAAKMTFFVKLTGKKRSLSFTRIKEIEDLIKKSK